MPESIQKNRWKCGFAMDRLKKDKRDLRVFFLWEGGAYNNGEIGAMFGIIYSAVSHIVKSVKAKVKTDQDFGNNCAHLNSQIKM